MTASTRSLSSSSSQVAECGWLFASYCMANSSCSRPTVRSSCSIADAFEPSKLDESHHGGQTEAHDRNAKQTRSTQARRIADCRGGGKPPTDANPQLCDFG